jgi:hypothetical protein
VVFKSPQPPSVSSRIDFSKACLPVGRGLGGLFVFIIQGNAAINTIATTIDDFLPKFNEIPEKDQKSREGENFFFRALATDRGLIAREVD